MAIVSPEHLNALVDQFFDKVIEELRPMEDRRERNRYLMMLRRQVYKNVYGKIDKKLQGPRTGDMQEDEEIRALWNHHPLISTQDLADMYALSPAGLNLRIQAMKKRGLEVLDGEERLRRRYAMQRERKAQDPRVKQAKKPRAFECTNCTYRWVEYMNAQQWQNWQAQQERAACKKCQKVGSLIGW